MQVQAETAEARLQLRELEAQRDELLRVETSLRELRDMFTQLAHLVALQVCVCVCVATAARAAGYVHAARVARGATGVCVRVVVMI